MKFKGTKGEWRISTSNEFGVLISTHPMSRDICTIWKYDNNFLENQEAKANAQLIVTAPKMLEMLNRIFIEKCNGVNNIDYSEIEKVINQATKID
jgi:hypothetical protein